jgi:starch synthase
MRVLYATSELFPLAKTGGLADVSAALPEALARLGVDIRIAIPGYPSALDGAQHLREVAPLDVPHGSAKARILAGTVPGSGLPLWIVDCPALFDRAGGLYQDAEGREWPDNAQRFALFSHGVAQIARELWSADVVHANDWHTGPVPLLLRGSGAPRAASLLTIHNLAYQGLFPMDQLSGLGLPEAYDAIEFHGRLSFLKAGIASADALTTVSPNYAQEITGPEQGCGLDGLLRQRRGDLVGIMNGADYSIWDPRIDPFLPRAYGQRDMAGKRETKCLVQAKLGLPVLPEAPLLVFLSRLDYQKMPDVVAAALPVLLEEEGAQFIMAAEGQTEFEDRFRVLAERFPAQVHVTPYSEPMAHQMLAAADILIHPSRFEPCGLVPIYAMRYGTVPVVRHSGGMVDSVTEVAAETLENRSATGFFFEPPTVDALIASTRRALTYYRQPITWRHIQRACMAKDFSWKDSARAYLELYRKIAGEAGAPERPSESLTA